MNLLKKLLQFELILLLLFITSTNVFAKRMPPPEVSPVIYHGVIYSAKYSTGGVIEAKDAKSKKQLWTKQIYHIHYISDLETDIQDVYIKAMKIKNGNLLITDEKDVQYLLNLKTRKVNNKSKQNLPQQ
jgi:hypothetical protein